MKHPLSRFAPFPLLYALRAVGGGRRPCGGAALARRRSLRLRQFYAVRVVRGAMEH